MELDLEWFPAHTGDSAFFLCAAGRQATLNSHFGARDGNNITSHPSGAWRGTRSLPQVSSFNIRVLYSEAARRSEIYDHCSVRSVWHKHAHTHKETKSQTHTCPPDSWIATETMKRCRSRWNRKVKGDCERQAGRMKWLIRVTENGWRKRGWVQPGHTLLKGMRMEIPRKITFVAHTHFPSFPRFPSIIGITY